MVLRDVTFNLEMLLTISTIIGVHVEVGRMYMVAKRLYMAVKETVHSS